MSHTAGQNTPHNARPKLQGTESKSDLSEYLEADSLSVNTVTLWLGTKAGAWHWQAEVGRAAHTFTVHCKTLP